MRLQEREMKIKIRELIKNMPRYKKRLKNKEISTWESYQDTFEASLAAVGASIGHFFRIMIMMKETILMIWQKKVSSGIKA